VRKGAGQLFNTYIFEGGGEDFALGRFLQEGQEDFDRLLRAARKGGRGARQS
jgi:hypothetical protein